MKNLNSYILASFCAVGAIGLLIYTTWFEPQNIELVQHDLRMAGESETLRLVQVSYLHLHHFGKHEKELTKCRIPDDRTAVLRINADAKLS